MPAPLVTLTGVCKTFTGGPQPVPVLREVDFTVAAGEFVAVMGPSGSGKSTLLHILGCLDRPDRGTYRLDGIDVAAAGDARRAGLRARHIGFVFQTFNLIETLTVVENVELPFVYAGGGTADVARRVTAAVARVGLGQRGGHRPHQLSGGELQRAAIARAVVMAPKLILADEPTGNLDSATGAEILDLFQDLNATGTTVVMVTHDPLVADRASRKEVLHDGRFR